VQRIIHEFGGLEEVLAASDDDLEAVEGGWLDEGQGTSAKDFRRPSGGRPGRPVLAELIPDGRPQGPPSLLKEATIPELAEVVDADEAVDVDLENRNPPRQPISRSVTNVVYPHHGAGVVLKKESKTLIGEKRDLPDDPDPPQQHDP